MTVQEINTKKEALLIEAKKLSALKAKLYGNVDITTPMSQDEKELNKKIATIYGDINSLIKLKRSLVNG